jgi:hypothetical protein
MNTPVRAALAALIVCTASPLAAQQSPAGHQPEEVAAILETLDRYMVAISANDLRTLEQMQTVDGMTYRASVDQAGRWTVRSRSNLEWVAPSQDDGRAYRERYWDPTVLVRGAIAVVWTPYEFWVDNQTSHCGIDIFSFVKMDGTWRVSNGMWTVEPGACNELRPADPSVIRPRD